MNGKDLERSSLFQLNVLIWAVLSLPETGPVTAVLGRHGYRLFSIEHPLEPAIGVRAMLQAMEPPVGISPVADVVLDRQDDSRIVLIECKASSFGVGSDQTEQTRAVTQARGYIMAASNITQRGLPVETTEGEVCYVVPGGDETRMEATLTALRDDLRAEVGQGCTVSAMGVFAREDGVYLGCEVASESQGSLASVMTPPQRVLALDPGQSPKPLFVIPWIPDSEDEDRSVLCEKLRSQILSHIGRSPLGEVSLHFDDLLFDVSRGYAEWRDRDTWRGHINREVGGIAQALMGPDSSVSFRRSHVVVTLDSPGAREKLMERIRVAKLPSRLQYDPQLSLPATSPDSTD